MKDVFLVFVEYLTGDVDGMPAYSDEDSGKFFLGVFTTGKKAQEAAIAFITKEIEQLLAQSNEEEPAFDESMIKTAWNDDGTGSATAEEAQEDYMGERGPMTLNVVRHELNSACSPYR